MSSIVDTGFKVKVTNAVQQILLESFNAGGKTQIRDMRGRLTFACPYCGDSSKDEHKKRGNLFWDSLKYHCYNDGCKKHRSLDFFLKDFGFKDSLSLEERIAVSTHIKTHSVSFSNKTVSLEYDIFKKLNQVAVPLSDFYKHAKCMPIRKNKQGYDVLRERLLVNKANEFAIGYNRLFILNLTADKRSVIGYQIRLLNTNSDNKYLSFNIKRKISAELRQIGRAHV